MLAVRRWVVGVLMAAATLGLGGVAMGCGDEFKCSTDYDCPATQVCNTTKKSGDGCEAFVCAVDADCGDPGKPVCRDNACVASGQ